MGLAPICELHCVCGFRPPCAGGPLGSGKQWVSWIHRDDLVDLIIDSIRNSSYAGVYNGTAPKPVTMAQLCSAVGGVMGRPSWLPVPDFAITTLLGEGAQVREGSGRRTGRQHSACWRRGPPGALPQANWCSHFLECGVLSGMHSQQAATTQSLATMLSDKAPASKQLSGCLHAAAVCLPRRRAGGAGGPEGAAHSRAASGLQVQVHRAGGCPEEPAQVKSCCLGVLSRAVLSVREGESVTDCLNCGVTESCLGVWCEFPLHAQLVRCVWAARSALDRQFRCYPARRSELVASLHACSQMRFNHSSQFNK